MRESQSPKTLENPHLRRLGGLALLALGAAAVVAPALASGDLPVVIPTLPDLSMLTRWSMLAIGGMLIAAHRTQITHGNQTIRVGAEVPLMALMAIWHTPLAACSAALVAGVGTLAAAYRLRAPQALTGALVSVAAGALAVTAGSSAAHALLPDLEASNYLAAGAVATSVGFAVFAVLVCGIRLVQRPGDRVVAGAQVVGTVALILLSLSVLAAGAAAPFATTPSIAFGVVAIACGLTALALQLLARSLRHADENATLRVAFRRFVASSVADRVLGSNSDSFDTIADQRTITVLFCDVQGFTSWAEHASPKEVVTDLNELLADLASAVLQTGGTIDKFTGDGLMAFWGAPEPQHDHASRALSAAPLLLMRAREFNIRREARGKQPLEIGIGIHTGPAIVGPVGHPERMDYTAMGDTVNVAARLESATRAQVSPVLLSESTFLKLSIDQQRSCTRLDSVDVKGRSERIRLYAPRGLVGELDRTG